MTSFLAFLGISLGEKKLQIIQIVVFQSMKRRHLRLGVQIIENFLPLSCHHSTEHERTTHHVRAEICCDDISHMRRRYSALFLQRYSI